jgi:hypothetical protein
MAVLAVGLEEHDPITRYAIDLFADELEEGEARTVALAYLRFAHQFSTLDAFSVIDRYPQLDDCVDPDDPDYTNKITGIAEMLKRHAEEAMRVVDAMIARKTTALARHLLPSRALLPLWIGQRDSAADRIEASPEATVPAANVPTFGVRMEESGSSFIRSGGVWVIEFRQEKAHIKHYRGMTQIAHLLENPKRPLDILALARCEAVPASKRGMGDGMAAGIGGGLGDALDRVGVEDFEHYLTELPASIDRARAAGRADEVNRLREEQRLVKQQLRAARNLRGRLRQEPGPEEKARKAVSKNITFCYGVVEGHLPQFVRHARHFVHLGIPPRYDPEPPEHWRVQR